MKKLFTLLALLAVPALGHAGFADLATSHANFQAIEYVKSQGIVHGYDNNTFRADSRINRAELAKILVAANFTQEQINSCEKSANGFPDVPVDAWFAPFVCIAKQNAIISGYGDGTFKPAQNVNFVEAAKMISLSFKQNDGGEGQWYAPFVNTLSNRSAIPTSINTLDKSITRGEMSEMVYRLHGKVTDKTALLFSNNQLVTAAQQETTRPEVENPIAAISDEQADCELNQGGIWSAATQTCETPLPPSGEPGTYTAINSTDWDAALGNKMIALFFHAGWCPSCVALDKEINDNLSLLPENSVIFKVDYDTATDLRKQFGVTQQHTAVFIDETKNAFLRKPGFTLQDLVDNL